MRPIVIVLVVVALAIAGLTAYLANSYLASNKTTQVVEVPSMATEKVLVAARPVNVGQVLVEDDLRYEDWPKQLVNPRFVVRGQGADDPKQRVLGATVKMPLLAGEPFLSEAVYRQDQGGGMAVLLGPGMRAISFSIGPTNAVSGFVTPNDRVDIVLSQTLKEQAGSIVTEVVLSDVRIVAVDQNTGHQGGAIVGKTVTVEVTPRDAERLIIAQQMGALSLVLRALHDAPVPVETEIGYTTSAMVSRVTGGDVAPVGDEGGADPVPAQATPAASSGSIEVKINRAGNISSQTFSN